MDEIRRYWQNLRAEYEAKFKEPFLKNYDKSVPFLEKMQNFLLEKHSQNPQNTDFVCFLASIKMELRSSYDDCARLLKNFLKENRANLLDQEKARIFTNIAFYHEFDKNAIKYLLKAKNLKSTYVQTYKGLGLYKFNLYNFEKNEENLKNATKNFKKAAEISDEYEFKFDYAVGLYEQKRYKKAKEIFANLLLAYPNRQRLLLALAYCEIYLGNKTKATCYLSQIKPDQDENYPLSTDEIDAIEIIDAYYVMGDYDKFLKLCSKVIKEYFHTDWEHYFYAFYIGNSNKKFDKLIAKYIDDFKQSIEKARMDEFDSKEEKEEYIKSCEEDLANFIKMIDSIKNQNHKPQIKLSLYPEYGCFLIDCLRHRL